MVSDVSVHRRRVRRRWVARCGLVVGLGAGGLWLTGYGPTPAPIPVRRAAEPALPFNYDVPVDPAAPWPLFRRDRRNTGQSALPATYAGDRPWSFATGKGIFSTPVIDGDGTVYVGSADHSFYAINVDGTLRWRFETGEIIDSAAALPRRELTGGRPAVIVPSGDGHLYALRTDAASGGKRELWRFDAKTAPRASYNNWFEGNVAVGFDGTLYAGNTNFNYYALNPDGTLKWVYPTGANNWSIAAQADDGTLFWGSNDTLVRAVRPDGVERWTRRTWGVIAASAAVGSDGTLYIGSFDSYLYALNPARGTARWTFKTNDHIYASVALGSGAGGATRAIYAASTDGRIYALDTAGRLLWSFDTGDPVRSSPAVGRTPDGQGDIVYVGAGNGKLYALNAADGTRRWAFDTTPGTGEARDRNDLNSSVALGHRGIYIGGEDGKLWYVPYEYCLQGSDPRCQGGAAREFPTDVQGLYYVTPGGSTLMSPPAELPAATVLTARLVVRKQGMTVDAFFCKTPWLCPREPIRVRVDPAVTTRVVPSADGRYVHIIPDEILEPGRSYRLRIDGDYYTGGWHLGNLTVGGRRAGHVSGEFTFRAAPVHQLPLRTEPDAVTAVEWTRLAVPIPPMLPSLNQIGFDYMDWIVGTVAVTSPDANGAGRVVLWAVGGRRDAAGRLVADPASDFVLPLAGEYRGDTFAVRSRTFTMRVTGIPIPFTLFEMRGQLGADGHVRPGATVYAEADALGIPTFGKYLVLAGLANNLYEKLIVAGTYVTRPYPSNGPANTRPEGVGVGGLRVLPATPQTPGHVVAEMRLAPGTTYAAADHRLGLLVLDAVTLQPVPLNYRDNLQVKTDAAGNPRELVLTVPAGTELPPALDVVVLADVFPVHRHRIDIPPQR